MTEQPSHYGIANSLESVSKLHGDLLASWNRRDAAAFAALFSDDGNSVGFDGSQLNGREQIGNTLAAIFAHHNPPAFFAIIREVRLLSADVGLLRADAGMADEGSSTIKADMNAIQSLVAQKDGDEWRIALFHNTPAQFHGRPDLAEAMSADLQRAWIAHGAG
ncbi:MAG TPA: SgcJ/EcaC family oxidoreductase [Capsulimonadaceae bacterium]|jgi:uncharacterized protein (TIGR02246 family)